MKYKLYTITVYPKENTLILLDYLVSSDFSNWIHLYSFTNYDYG